VSENGLASLLMHNRSFSIAVNCIDIKTQYSSALKQKLLMIAQLLRWPHISISE